MLLLFIFLCTCSCYQILHLTDFHLDVDYSTDPKLNTNNSCLEHLLNPNKTMGYYGEFACDTSESLLDYSMSEAARIIPQPDVIIWTGDSVGHVKKWEQDHKYVVNAMVKGTEAILKYYPTPKHFLPTFGNHDNAPDNEFTAKSGIYRDAWELWAPYVGEENKETFLRGGYYNTYINHAIYLVLNTNIYYKFNNAYDRFQNKEDPAHQFEFMINTLESARNCSRTRVMGCISTVHIVAHIAPGVRLYFRDRSQQCALSVNVHTGIISRRVQQAVLSIVAEYANVIGGMFFGHNHRDTFHIVKDSNETPVQVCLIAPSVTPWNSTTAGAHNPAFRIIEMSDDNRVTDVLTYDVDLDALNRNNKTRFELEYFFRRDYGIDEVNGSTMSSLLGQLKRDEDLFRKHFTYSSASKNRATPSEVRSDFMALAVSLVCMKK